MIGNAILFKWQDHSGGMFSWLIVNLVRTYLRLRFIMFVTQTAGN
jgi:hypothetical protein